MHSSGILFPIPITIGIIFLLAFISFFFSASETAVIGLSKIRLRHMVRKGLKNAKKVEGLVKKLDKFIAAILIGNDFVNIAISAIATAIFVHLFGYRLGVIASTFIATFFVLIVCEITPKILATKHTEKVATLTAPVMEFCIKAFRPFILIFTGTSNFILKIFRVGPMKRSPLITEEELRMMIEIGKEEGVLSDEERRMLQRIFEFGDIKVKDVMAPKDQIIALNINSSGDEVLQAFIEQGHGRLPVYRDSIENIVGIVYDHDALYILCNNKLFMLPDLMQEPYYVPETTRISQLMLKFRQDKIQMAIVVDRNKKTLGLVTLEDLLEEIVGEIEERPSRRRGRPPKQAK